MIRLNILRTATLLPHAIMRPIAFLIILILAVVLGVLQIKGKPGRADNPLRLNSVKTTQNSETIPDTVKTEPGQTSSPPPGVTYKEVFDYQLRDYKSKLDSLDANVKLQALFIVFTILLILRRSDSLNLFGNQLPLQWLHLFVPIVMLYLWLDFGFLLHGLIQSRLEGIKIITDLSPSTATLGKQLFRDSGFIDGWFLSFVDAPKPPEIGDHSWFGNYSGIDHNFRSSTATGLVLVLGTLMSAAHACMIALTFIGCRRYWRRPSSQFLLAYYIIPFVLLVFLIASHIQFAYGGWNRNYIQLYIAFVAIPLVAFLLWLAVLVDREVDPASVQRLRRQRRLAHPGSLVRTTQESDPVEASRTISLIGDSLSTGFYVGSIPGMLLRMWRAWRGTWFVGLPSHGSEPPSVFERLYEVTPVSAVLHATPRAKVDAGGSRSFVDLVTKTWHLSHQVDEVLIGEFPSLLLIWIGHNNIDWRFEVESLTDEACEELSAKFAGYYKKQLQRLLKGAVISKKPIVIIVYGLINFESFFKARQEAEERRKADSIHYPYLEKDYDYFTSLRPEHRSGMTRLAQCYNQSIKDMCKEFKEEIERSDVQLVYSDALSRAEITGADMLNESDAWHPSPAGHRLLAQSAYATIKEQLKYLGWEPES